MNWQHECAAIIPCLNEANHIEPLVRDVRHYTETVFVVDDGSTDSTPTLARNAGAIVLNHRSSEGKGAALATGWREALARGFKWGFALDGDGQHSPEDMPAFFNCAETTAATLVIGNRMGASHQMPWLRRRVNRWMSAQISQLAGRDLPDSQCGFRLMNLEIWSRLELAARHFEVESDVLLSFVAAGHRVEFVPVQVIYKREQSKIHPVRDTARWFRWWRGARRRYANEARGRVNQRRGVAL
jgi:glycosyltransferase involved in cell wall biosynthesis